MALTHGYVVGELIYSRADGPDPDRLPDEIPATDVKLKIIPAAKQFVSPTGRLVVLDEIPAAVMADGSVTGDVEEDGTPKVDATAGLWLVVGTYTVTAKGHYRNFTITVTEDHTEEAPLNLGDAIGYVPPGVTMQSLTVPPGATDGQVLGWDGGLKWVVGGSGGTVTWENIDEKPAFVAAGATQSAARDAIGAGTSNLTIGTTGSTAAAGDHGHSEYAAKVGSGNSSITGIEYYPTTNDLPATGTTGVLYIVPAEEV